MKKLLTIIPFNLSLFDGEGDGAQGEAPQTNNTPTTEGNTGDIQNDTLDAGANSPTEENNAVDLRQKYDDFFKDDEMKKFYKQDTQKIINRRFKEVKALETELAGHKDVLEKLYSKYDVDNIGALSSAIDNDDALWEDAAFNMGMSVEQYKNFKNMERKAKAAEEFMENQRRRNEAQAQYQRWIDEAAAVREIYPEFNLERELENPNFRGLLGQKDPDYALPMQTIYEICHMNDIKNNIARNVAKQTEKQVMDNVRARGQRPQEGAARNNTPVEVTKDIKSLTLDEINEIMKRTAKGERITF